MEKIKRDVKQKEKRMKNRHRHVRKIMYIITFNACMLSHVWLFMTPWMVAHQAPLSMGFSRKEYWSRLPYPTPGDLPNPGIEPESLTSPAWQVDSLPLAPPSTIVVQSLSHVWLCDPINCSTPGFHVLHHLPELAQMHVHWVSGAIQPSCPPSSPSALNLSEH